MANPTDIAQNQTIAASCESFESLTDILTYSNPAEQNLTSLTTQCPELCLLIWGEGNPDLTGIGVLVSYIIQLVLIIFYGLPFIFIHKKVNPKWKTKLDELFTDAFTTNVIFSISVATATLIWLHQEAPLFDVAIMCDLNTMAFITLLGLAMSSNMIEGGRAAESEEGKKRFRLVLLGLVVECALYIATFVTVRQQQSDIPVGKLLELVDGCGAQLYRGIVPDVDSTAKSDASWEQRLQQSRDILPGAIMAGVLGFFVIGYYLVAQNVVYPTQVGNGKVYKLRLGFMCSAGIWTALIWCLSQIITRRNDLREILGDQFEDDQWGFGQVLAVFAWLPQLFKLTKGALFGLIYLGKLVFLGHKHTQMDPQVDKYPATGADPDGVTQNPSSSLLPPPSGSEEGGNPLRHRMAV